MEHKYSVVTIPGEGYKWAARVFVLLACVCCWYTFNIDWKVGALGWAMCAYFVCRFIDCRKKVLEEARDDLYEDTFK